MMQTVVHEHNCDHIMPHGEATGWWTGELSLVAPPCTSDMIGLK